MKKSISRPLGIALTLLFVGLAASSQAADSPINGDVTVQKVSFPHQTVKMVGNLFVPANFDKSKRYPTIVVTHPFGGVKEQAAGLYAKKLAEQGFITLAFDASHYGESGGEPRQAEVPTDRVDDIRSAVDYLSNHPQVDAQRIGALGICAGGGYTMNAAQTEHRIKAAAGVSTFDVGTARREGVGGTISYEARMKRLDEIAQQRSREARGEPIRYISFLPESDAEAAANPSVTYREGYDYYMKIARHPHSTGKYAFTSLGWQMAFFPFEQMETISPRPILLVAGSKADTLFMSQAAYNKAKEPRELFVVPGASHIDLYYKPEFVPTVVAKLKDFFDKALR